jgi:hypothetical protein
MLTHPGRRAEVVPLLEVVDEPVRERGGVDPESSIAAKDSLARTRDSLVRARYPSRAGRPTRQAPRATDVGLTTRQRGGAAGEGSANRTLRSRGLPAGGVYVAYRLTR